METEIKTKSETQTKRATETQRENEMERETEIERQIKQGSLAPSPIDFIVVLADFPASLGFCWVPSEARATSRDNRMN